MAAATFALPEVIDITAVARLRTDLMDLTGGDLEIDASAVERIGGLGIQLLLSAEKMWAANGKQLSITGASAAFQDVHRLTDA